MFFFCGLNDLRFLWYKVLFFMYYEELMFYELGCILRNILIVLYNLLLIVFVCFGNILVSVMNLFIVRFVFGVILVR